MFSSGHFMIMDPDLKFLSKQIIAFNVQRIWFPKTIQILLPPGPPPKKKRKISPESIPKSHCAIIKIVILPQKKTG
jgi:hypothetical protein